MSEYRDELDHASKWLSSFSSGNKAVDKETKKLLARVPK